MEIIMGFIDNINDVDKYSDEEILYTDLTTSLNQPVTPKYTNVERGLNSGSRLYSGNSSRYTTTSIRSNNEEATYNLLDQQHVQENIKDEKLIENIGDVVIKWSTGSAICRLTFSSIIYQIFPSY